MEFRQASVHCQRVLEAAIRAYANKTEESMISQKPGLQDFWLIAHSVFNESKSAIPPLFNRHEVFLRCSSKIDC